MVESRTYATGPAQFAGTDMMHRRVPLPYEFHLALTESMVLIKTDSPLIGEALGSRARSAGTSGNGHAAVWEIGVEIQNETGWLPGQRDEEGFETYNFGSSRSLRMDSGSWFAHTPPSLSGVGFAMLGGDAFSKIRQLAALLENIEHFLGDRGMHLDRHMDREVPA